MKKAILVPPSRTDKGTYKIKGGGKFDGYKIWNTQKRGVVADLKADGNKVYERDWEFKNGNWQEILKTI